MPDTYEVQTPDGKTLEIQSDRQPTPEDALRAIRAYGDHQAAAAQAKAEAGSTVGAAFRPLVKGAIDALPGVGAVVGGVLSTPETGGVGTIPGIALGAGAGRGVRDLIAAGLGMEKPSTATGEGAKIAGETALAGGSAAILPGVVASAKAPLQTLREGAEHFGDAMPAAIRRLGGLFKSMPKPAAPILERPAWQTWGDTAPSSTASTAAPAVDIEAELRAAGLDPSKMISATPGAQARATNMTTGRLVKMAEATPPPSPLQQPRVQVGAEVVGRENGLTKEAVRQQTGPILNEATGEASPVFPEKPFERMHDKLLGMGHGNPARLDYVKAAADQKTAGLLEAMRRTLERNGLVLGGMTTAEAVRRAVMAKLRGSEQK